MTSIVPRGRSLIDWLESPWPLERNLVRVEERFEDGNYVVRAELPGFDPEKHIHVSTEAGLLTISAERETRAKETGRSEFHYGKFSRTVPLPKGADATKITAKYTDGILDVTVPVRERESGKPVEIQVGHD